VRLSLLRRVFSNDGPANQFRDLRHDSVSKSGQSVFSHRCGNPIMPFTHEGHGTPTKKFDSSICFPIRIRR
jgi:hypothetical protein